MFFLPKHKGLGMAKSKVGKGKSGGFGFTISLALLRGLYFFGVWVGGDYRLQETILE